MSKTPLISLNDGTSWADAVPKLRTDELGASTTDWVQEDDTKAASLKVTANGTYAAASAGKYGYDYVTVSVKGGSATGIGPDGNEHTVTPDPETGRLVDEVIPSSIVVTTPPTVTTYQDGDTIDFTGIVVTAYTLDGEVWEDSSHPGGVISVSELEFPVTVAEIDTPEEWSDLNGCNARELYFTAHYGKIVNTETGRETEYTVYCDNVIIGTILGIDSTLSGISPGTILATKYNNELYVAAVSYTDQINNASNYGDGIPDPFGPYIDYGWHTVASSSFRPSVDRFARCYWGSSDIFNIPESTVDPTQIDPSSLGVIQDIPVNWQRPGDGAVLEASFPINVTPAGT